MLNARRALRGAEDCLENTFGRQIPDGAQCFVIEEQANYRLVHSCSLKEDDRYVVIPYGDRYGRWVRAEGLVGFALLEGGKATESKGVVTFGGFTYQKLVQFELTDDALVYVGSVPRLAHVSASAGGVLILNITIPTQGIDRLIGEGHNPRVTMLIHPGDKLVVRVASVDMIPQHGFCIAEHTLNLQVILA